MEMECVFRRFRSGFFLPDGSSDRVFTAELLQGGNPLSSRLHHTGNIENLEVNIFLLTVLPTHFTLNGLIRYTVHGIRYTWQQGEPVLHTYWGLGGSASPPVVDVCSGVSCAVSLNKEMSYFRSLFNLCCKDYVAFRILDLQYASLVGNRWSVQVSRDLVANFNVIR